MEMKLHVNMMQNLVMLMKEETFNVSSQLSKKLIIEFNSGLYFPAIYDYSYHNIEGLVIIWVIHNLTNLLFQMLSISSDVEGIIIKY